MMGMGENRMTPDFVSGLIITDANLKVIAADRFFVDGIGHPADELTGKHLAEVLGPPAAAHDALAGVAEDEGGRIYTRRVAPSGRPRMLRVSYSSLKLEGGEKGVMITVEDLTSGHA